MMRQVPSVNEPMAGLTTGPRYGYENRATTGAKFLVNHMKNRISNTLICLIILSSSGQAGAKPRLYLRVHDVKLGASVSKKKDCQILGKARELLSSELKSRPEVVTELEGGGRNLEKELKKRGLKGYALVLRITGCKHQVLPPAQGKVYRVLMVEAAVAIDAERIPSGQMALAGEGQASVGTEISRVKDREKQQLLHEALGAAIKQAVSRCIDTTSKPERKRRRKRPRRRR